MLLRAMLASDRKTRSRAVLVFFGLDPAPPSFRRARPPTSDVLRARYCSTSRTRSVVPDLICKSVLQKGRNVLLHSMWKRAYGGLCWLSAEGEYI